MGNRRRIGAFIEQFEINLFSALFAWPPVRWTRTTIVLRPVAAVFFLPLSFSRGES